MGRREANEELEPGTEPHEAGSAPPWERPLDRIVFLTLWTSGPDPARGALLRIQALELGPGGESRDIGLWCSPANVEGLDPLGSLQERLRGFVPPGEIASALAALADSAPPAECWEQLEAFVGDCLVVVTDASEFDVWNAALSSDVTRLSRVTGLGEVAALLYPGRLAQRPTELVNELCGSAKARAGEGVGPVELRSALTKLTRRFLSHDRDTVHSISVSLATTWARLFVTEPEGAARIARILALFKWIDLWLEGNSQGETITALRFESDSVETEFLQLILADARPRWQLEAEEWLGFDPLPPQRQGALPWTPRDEALLDLAFKEHLPALIAEEQGEPARDCYRESQHSVSREVAANFGHKGHPETQLLLVHAPTGTGKTLAYLLPALLWAKRHEVRVGISTYTRALQEQATDREVPRALEVLRRSGLAPGLRVSMLKGRENYLCWRTLKLQIPTFEATGEQWLAFSQLLAFSLSDPSGDLDRLPQRSPVELSHNATYRETLADLLKHVRARTSCCRVKEDKQSCAAEVARRRAERSHLVITNHSFALARQEFFRHIVFDECEHLHDQAHSAWSHTVSLHGISMLLDRLYVPEQSQSRSLLVRVAKRLVPGSPGWETLEVCRERWSALSSAFEELRKEAGAFDTWRKARARERDEREDHSLLREYAEGDLGRALILKKASFCQAGNQLDEKLAELSERLEGLGTGRMARLRRTIDLVRTDLVEVLDAINAWLPLQEGRPCFNARTFHDIEVDASGGLQLSARVLLPNEYLGQFYYPQLSTATFLSATTFIQDGFGAAAAYLGLDRAVQAADEEPDQLCTLRTFRAPEVFNYSRVLVTIPRDAPAIARDKDAFLHYVRDFIADLGERTDGRILALFTNAADVKCVGARLEGHFRARHIGFWYQNMPGTSKEEMSEMFRLRTDSVLLGVDTFWYGADFPGETLEHLIIVRLPYGVPDRYHHAQCAVLGAVEQRRQIYLPRALAKFRQGFGRLMRRLTDRGCVYLLDHRIVDPRHRAFLRELPIARVGENVDGLARLVRSDTSRCLIQALIHMDLEESARPLEVQGPADRHIERFEPEHERVQETNSAPADINVEDLPF